MPLIPLWKKIHFNVSGCTYETWESTLERFPNTLLGNISRRCKFYDKNKHCYFFNRSRIAFDAILFFYQSNGCLVRPPSLPMSIFEYECLFYDLGDEAIARMKTREGYDAKKKIFNSKSRKGCKTTLWQFLEYPESSCASKIYTYISLSLILLIVAMDCLETIPTLFPEQEEIKNEESRYFQNRTFEKVFRLTKLSINIFFAIEFMLRFITSPRKCKFVGQIGNIIDFVAIFPSILTYCLQNRRLNVIMVTRVLRTFRIFRLIRLSKNFRSLSVVLHIIANSLRNLFLLMFCMFISITLFGSMIYYTELGTSKTPIKSIPEGMYFAMQTVVSVGYGDIIPASVLGKITASVTAVIGALTMTLPLLSLGGKYFSIYTKTFEVALSSQVVTKPSAKAIEHFDKQLKSLR